MMFTHRLFTLGRTALVLVALRHYFEPTHALTAYAPTSRSYVAATGVSRSRSLPTSLRASETEESPQRQPWEALRFLRQSSSFLRPPNPFKGAPGNALVVKPGDVLWSAGGQGAGPKISWASLDDVVMGGASSSGFDNETGRWTGTVTSANNGGFVGVRTKPFEPALDMSKCQGIEFRLREGNGRRYKAVVRDSTEFNGVCWSSTFDAPRKGLLGGGNGGGGSVRLPFARNIPTIFANTVSGKTFQAGNVVGIQLVYSKFEFEGELNPNFELGDFSIQVLEVKAY